MSRFRVDLAVVAMIAVGVFVFTGGGGVANAAAIPPFHGGSITTVCAGTPNGSGTFTLTADCGPTTAPITVPVGITTVDGNGHTISATDVTTPASPQFNGGILTNENGHHTMNIENLTVSGPATGFQVCTNSGNVLYGIHFNDASGSVNHVTVRHIWQHPNASNAPSCNTGTAIRAENPSAARTVTITDTKVMDYQKNGIDGRGATMTMDVSGSTMGPPNDQEGLIAPNGLVYYDSTGTAMDNTILGSGDQACAPAPAPCFPGTGGKTNATAVLLYGAKNVTITHNTITGDKTDIGVSVTTGSTASTGSIISFNNFTRTSPDNPDPTGHGIDVSTPDGSSATPICNTFSNWNINIVGAEQISCTPLPNGNECQAYSAPAPAVDSGKNYDQTGTVIDATPFTWTVHSGTLPPGLSLSSAGAITGTPTAAGTFNFTMKVVDATGLTATQPQTITIAPGCAPPPTHQSTVEVVKAWVGAPSTTTIFVDADGHAPYDASVVADTNGATTSFKYPVSTSVTVGEVTVPSGYTATIDCGHGAQYSKPIRVTAPATAGATLGCQIVNTKTPAPPSRPTLVLRKVSNKHVVHSGDTIQFKITIRALGKGKATNLQVCDRLPPGFVLVRAPGATLSGGRACWRIPSISAGHSRSFHVVVRTRSVQGATVRTNVATVVAPGTSCTARRASRPASRSEAVASLSRCRATARVLVRKRVPPPPPPRVTG